MCGSTKAPQVVQQNPVAEAKAADAKAAKAANSETSLRRQQRAQNSLLTMGAGGTDAAVNTPYNLLSTASRPTSAPTPIRRNPKMMPGDRLDPNNLLGS